MIDFQKTIKQIRYDVDSHIAIWGPVLVKHDLDYSDIGTQLSHNSRHILLEIYEELERIMRCRKKII